MTYIAFLRGINVGGHRVSMEALRAHFTELGLTGVRSYIQSGNVFFEAPADEDRTALTTRLEQHLRARLGYEVPVFLRSTEELAALLALDPFRGVEVSDNLRLCLMLLAEPVPAGLALPLRAPKGDLEIVAVADRAAFVVWHLIDGRPPAASSGTFLDKALGKRNTTRFFGTAAKILAAATQAG